MSESLTVIFTHAYVNKLYLRKFNLLSVLLTDVMVITRINSSATKTKMSINYNVSGFGKFTLHKLRRLIKNRTVVCPNLYFL